MNAIALIVAAALAFGLGALAVLIWAMQSGQYDDLDGAANRILIDDE
jgi:cbb3-type cytochrome oxidase maturation protein